MTGRSAAAATWRPPALPAALVVLAVAGRAVAAPTTATTLSDEEERLADEAADQDRSVLVGAGVFVLLVVLFCAWLAVVSTYGYLYGFRPSSSVQEACKAGLVPVANDAVTSPPTYTSPTKPGHEPGDNPVASMPSKEPPCQLQDEIWKAPKDDAPDELAQSWVAMAPLQTCALENQRVRTPATVALQEPSANEGVMSELAADSRAAESRQAPGGTGRPPGWALEEAEAASDTKPDDQDHTAIQPAGRAQLPVEFPRSPPPTSLCWNSCVSLVCCSVASPTRSL